jgi:hypothetical protein
MLQSVKVNRSNKEFSLCWSIITVYFTNPGETGRIVTNFKQQVVRGVGMPVKWEFLNSSKVLFSPSLQSRPAV